jgi:hypothetical protein
LSSFAIVMLPSFCKVNSLVNITMIPTISYKFAFVTPFVRIRPPIVVLGSLESKI